MMSQNMEREKNESLTQRQKEEEEHMKQELIGMGMYDPGDTYDRMKAILDVISESKGMAQGDNSIRMDVHNKNTKKASGSTSNNFVLEETPKTSMCQDTEIEDQNEIPKTNFSYQTDHVSTVSNRKLIRSSNSPESVSSIFETRGLLSRHRESGSDEAYEKTQDNSDVRESCSHSTNKYLPLKLRNCKQELQNLHSFDAKMDVQSDHNQQLERWRIDPFDSYIDENDVPLQTQHRRIVQERTPFGCCKDAKTTEKQDRISVDVNLHLAKMADLWRSWHCTAEPKFQWGSPIQVGTANGSLDKNLRDTKSEQQSLLDNEDSHARASKRKARLMLSMKPIIPDSDDDSGEDEEFHNFASFKKQKLQHSKTYKAYDRQSRANVESFLNPLKKTKELYPDNVEHCNDVNIKSLHMETHTEHIGEVCQNILTDASDMYSKRTVSPNSRNSFKQKRTTTIFTNQGDRNEEKHENVSSISAEEHGLTLVQSHIECTEEDAGNKKEFIKIKPLPVKLCKLTVKLDRECISLAERHRLKKQKEHVKERRHLEEATKRKQEFQKRLMQNIQDEYQENKDIETVQKEKTVTWNKKLARRRRLYDEKEKSVFLKNERLDSSKGYVSTQSSNSVSNIDVCVENKVTCPICGKSLSANKIEDHAATCEQYNSDISAHDTKRSLQSKISSTNATPKKKAKSSRISFECNVCSSFKTDNGIDYEEHVASCLEHQQRQKDVPGSITSVVNGASTSFIPSYRPISNQTDLEIDYTKQFPTNRSRSANKRKKH